VTRDEIDRLLERHYAAEKKRDIDAILATYTEDIEHDAVGRQPNPIKGKAAIGSFYREFLGDLEHATVRPVRRFYGEDFVVDESVVEGYAHGRPFDLEGYGRPVEFRLLHIFEFRDGLISRENAWLDALAIQQQLAPPRHG
jgi:steroid delta-isomerase-like uncharacterized protein